MDFILLGLCLYGFFKGYMKGFISMFFSLLGTFLIFILAWNFSEGLTPYFSNFLGDDINSFLKINIDNLFPGNFSNIEEFGGFVEQTKFGIIFKFFLTKLIGDISIEGEMTAGQILAPSLTNLLVKLITFLILFMVTFVFQKILQFIFTNTIKTLGWNSGNRILGAFVGIVKGLTIFGVFYFIISLMANFTLNETLLQFLNSGVLSNYVYEKIIKTAINLFY